MHAMAALAFFAALYVPFLDGWRVPPGSIGAFVDRFRFNALAFDPIAAVIGARPATVVAVLAGLGVSVFLRARLRATHPAAWAWPMAAALVFSPVIYPWYLVWLVPFLFDRSTLPLLVWTIAIMPTYLVWGLAREGHPWTVPNGILAVEYGAVALAVVLQTTLSGRRTLRS